MAIIPQKQLFGWEEIEALGDLERLRLVLDHLPDELLMRILEAERGNGRDDYPVRVIWNSILAGIVFQHPSIESLRRELLRNGQLRQLCGFDVTKGERAVPPSWSYTRFLQRLVAHQDIIDRIFEGLVDSLGEVLPGFGKTLAVDGKAIRSHGRPRKKDSEVPLPDGRRDTDADFGAKTYRKKNADGTESKQAKFWYGYKVHLVVDADYELPVAYSLTLASQAEQPEARRMLDHLEKRHSGLLEDCETFIGDKGYDDTKILKRLWDDHGIRPVIKIRSMWSPDEPTRRVKHLRNVVYDEKGRVYCYPRRGEPRRMAFGGFESDRRTLKYRCPAKQYGVECPDVGRCPVKGSVRIKLSEERRVLLPLARTTHRWKDIYDKRSAVERVNSRLDVSFGFEHHFIRGQKKMQLRVSLALTVMLTMALGRVREKRKELMRSLVKAA